MGILSVRRLKHTIHLVSTSETLGMWHMRSVVAAAALIVFAAARQCPLSCLNEMENICRSQRGDYGSCTTCLLENAPYLGGKPGNCPQDPPWGGGDPAGVRECVKEFCNSSTSQAIPRAPQCAATGGFCGFNSTSSQTVNCCTGLICYSPQVGLPSSICGEPTVEVSSSPQWSFWTGPYGCGGDKNCLNCTAVEAEQACQKYTAMIMDDYDIVQPPPPNFRGDFSCCSEVLGPIKSKWNVTNCFFCNGPSKCF